MSFDPRDNEKFQRAYRYLIDNESDRFVNDAHDPGGPTKYGITIHTLASWRDMPVTPEDVEALTELEAQEIYLDRYWYPLSCDQLPDPVAICIFDSGVLYGTLVSGMLAQETANAHGDELAVDGILGPLSVAVIAAIDPKTFIVGFSQGILARIDALVGQRPVLGKFRQGWVNRAERLLSLVPQTTET